MIAFDQVVSPLTINVFDAFEMRVISSVNLTNDTVISRSLVCDDCGRAVEPDALDRLVEKSLCRLCDPPSGEMKIYQLAIRIDSAPQVSPFTADTDVSFIHVSIEAGAAQVFLCPFDEFRSKLDHPAIHSRPINTDPTLGEQIDHVLIG